MSGSRGTSFVELMVVMAVMSLLVGCLSLFLAPMEGRLDGAARSTEAFFRQARVTAMATTSAYRIRPADSTTMIVETAGSCGAASWIVDDTLVLDLPRGIVLDDTGWTLCYGSRGTASANLLIGLQDEDGAMRDIEVLRGGTTRQQS